MSTTEEINVENVAPAATTSELSDDHQHITTEEVDPVKIYTEKVPNTALPETEVSINEPTPTFDEATVAAMLARPDSDHEDELMDEMIGPQFPEIIRAENDEDFVPSPIRKRGGRRRGRGRGRAGYRRPITPTTGGRGRGRGYRSFRCRICEKGFWTRESLITHHHKHTEEEQFEMGVGMGFAYPSFSQFGNMQLLVCPICDKTFKRKAIMDCHLRRHTGDRPFKCDTCDKGFIDRLNYDRHAKECFGSDYFKCLKCLRKFKYPHAKDKHFKMCERGSIRYPCATCGAVFDFKNDLHDHIPDCGGSIIDDDLILLDDDDHESQVKADLVANRCQVCRKTFNTSQELGEHKTESGHAGMISASGLPSSSISNKNRRPTDRSRPVPSPVLGTYPCPMCMSRFENVEVLKVHVSERHRVRVVEAYAKPEDIAVLGEVATSIPQANIELIENARRYTDGAIDSHFDNY